MLRYAHRRGALSRCARSIPISLSSVPDASRRAVLLGRASVSKELGNFLAADCAFLRPLGQCFRCLDPQRRSIASGPGPGVGGAEASKASTRGVASALAKPSKTSSRSLAGYAKKGQKIVVKLGHKTIDTLRWFVRKVGVLCWAFVKNPLIVIEWGEDLRDAVKHFLKWMYTGFKLFGADVRASYFLTKRVFKGYPLSVRERRLLVRTTSDCLKLIPFSFFLVVPFAEFALPFFLRLFPNMMPSTFFEQKYDNATLARKLKAKQEMADFWQQVVAQRTQELYESDEYADKAEELVAFQEKLTEGKEYPTLKEILRFASIFKNEMHLEKMSSQQLSALSQMLGLPTSSAFWQGHLEVQLRHHITNLRREDRDLFWEGIESLKGEELIDVCRRRAIRFHGVTEEEMRDDLNRWLRLSANHRQVPTSMLLWIQSFYLRDRTEDESSTEALKLKVQEQEVIENPEEAFLSFAERQKEAVDKMQQKLDDLQREITEVTEQNQDVLNEASEAQGQRADGAVEACANCGHMLQADSVYCRKCGHKREQADLDYDDPEGEKRRMLQILRKVEEDLDLYKQVVQKQRSMLERQLRYLFSMRDTTPTCQKDADVILLDQRVRLLEMIGSFQQSAEEIDQLFNDKVSKEAETVVSSSLWDDYELPGDPRAEERSSSASRAASPPP